MNKKYQVCAYIGRQQPTHVAHLATILEAFNHAEHVLVVLGSHNSPRTIQNPWSMEERSEMIFNSLPEEFHHRIHFIGAEDFLYSDSKWLTELTKNIREESQYITCEDDPTIALIAYEKDDTTYYLNYFKDIWDIIPMTEVTVGTEDSPSLSSTKIRELYFEGYLDFISKVCPPGTYNFLKDFYQTENYISLRKEYDDAIKYQKMFENAPYGYTNFLTVDSVVVQSGHVLLIQRGENPGRGLWALPGGHLEVNERFLDGAIRELREETGLKIPEKVLKGSIFHEHVFDHPNRSLRCRVKGKYGRTVTMAYGFKLDDSEKLPRVRGASDAKIAKWIPLDVVINTMKDQLFEDHWHLISHFVNKL